MLDKAFFVTCLCLVLSLSLAFVEGVSPSIIYQVALGNCTNQNNDHSCVLFEANLNQTSAQVIALIDWKNPLIQSNFSKSHVAINFTVSNLSCDHIETWIGIDEIPLSFTGNSPFKYSTVKNGFHAVIAELEVKRYLVFSFFNTTNCNDATYTLKGYSMKHVFGVKQK
eukprot:TRINITY_DN4920_c0_g1_i2.p1 TRINITY_DN4920_c0_g1~~TRINITY_DN4920_c0_g1_i2.p1  ORF type:complete len:168 (+),score=7.06 TRINITY_DN4920_c0_g1_i2:16-519(+)